MKGIFEMILGSGSGVGEETLASIGIPLKAGGHDVMCPVSKPCASYGDLEIEVQTIKDELDALLQRAKESFEVSANVFSGMPSVFSSRYYSETGLLV